MLFFDQSGNIKELHINQHYRQSRKDNVLCSRRKKGKPTIFVDHRCFLVRTLN